MYDEVAFRSALVAEPGDRNLQLVFADWLDEQGRTEEAAEVRQRVADEELAGAVRCAVGERATVFTRENSAGAKGYDARRASTCFDRYPNCRVAVIGAVPPSDLNLEQGTEVVVYYQKGRWVGRYRSYCAGPTAGQEPAPVPITEPVGARGA